jgi:hypothetical protein
MPADSDALLQYLHSQGASRSSDIQKALGKSQPTVSRLLAQLPGQVLTLGQGKSARYAQPQPIAGGAAQQPLWRVDTAGLAQPLGILSLLARDHIHIEAPGLDVLSTTGLPWYLSPLQAQGFLGRLLAQSLAGSGVPGNPESWGVPAVLTAALHLHDAPGALVLGHLHMATRLPALPAPGPDLGPALDALACNIGHNLPAGASAGGEQPKFLATNHLGTPVLVKFSPPRGTPFGERWHDLLHAEALCLQVLQTYGQRVAACEVVHSHTRTYLVSQRFDRIGNAGRQHVVSVGAAHTAFVPGGYQHWAATCDALARQGRLSASDAQDALFRLQFGHLVGNTDMHAGNLGLFAQGDTLKDIAKGRFALAPVYDMLPMRYQPDAQTGGLDYAAFPTTGFWANATALAAARQFWSLLAEHPQVSLELGGLGRTMVQSAA